MIIKGADWFVDAASWIARYTGMSQVLIGATIVSLGTTLPELLVSTTSAYSGYTDMALGNAIGSTICNIGLILGICNLISPTKISSRSYYIKALVMVISAMSLMFMVIDGKIGRIDTIILFLGIALYIFINYIEISFKQNSQIDNSFDSQIMPLGAIAGKNTLKFISGAVFIFFGAKLLVEKGIVIASILNVPNSIISLTLIALGTSLPELVTSIVALIKGHRGLSVGNIIGANILNLSMVIGFSSIFKPIIVPIQTIKLDLPFLLIIMTILVLPTFFFKKISRLQSAILLSLYGLYIYNLLSLHLV